MRPNVITVLGQPFEIVYEPRGVLAGENAGKADHAGQRLIVSEGQGAHQERDTLLHEVLHICGLMIGHELDEHQVASVTPVLLDVLRSNPEVVAYLTERME